MAEAQHQGFKDSRKLPGPSLVTTVTTSAPSKHFGRHQDPGCRLSRALLHHESDPGASPNGGSAE
ncbi:uncharacterized protein BP5553_03817 [Venustampulla echinocandica]|uniref:Uncharacterized protein n=1 Tax=Venustampulla echinocandica TaxID=2656787 RepID=A0A370TVB9_9HELO|nr:uncharacterized protein BP5553_03817 [Venustampulla echinocandica]RDL39477.1 hypothetical protein BP5553_03817 [Venustampulla echinocandica]